MKQTRAPKKSALVIGGGIAGLAAALELSRNKISTTVLEAGNHFGGRIHTLQPNSAPIELGAEFVHGKSKPLLAAIRHAQLATQTIPDKHRLFDAGKFREIKLLDIVSEVLNRIDTRQPDCSIEKFLSANAVEEPARGFVLNFIKGFDAANPEHISAHACRRAEYAAEQMHGETQLRVTKGYGSLVEHFTREIKELGGILATGTMVRRIGWEPGNVQVHVERHGRTETFFADTAIVTLPLGVLKTKHVLFEPAVPEKTDAIHCMKFGNVIKILFQFKDTTWNDFGFIHSFGEAIPTWWSDARGPILTGWAGGPMADALLKLTPAKLETLGLEILGRIVFDGASVSSLRKRLVASHYHNWTHDPLVRGAYSYIPVNGLDLPKVLAAPVADTLYFAGEATVTDAQTGTVFGALETGLRAARELLQS
jgi:monoamine oxidase